MRCAVSFLSVIVLVIGVGIAAFFIIWTTDEDCKSFLHTMCVYVSCNSLACL